MGEIGQPRETVLKVLQFWEIQAIINGYRKREHADWQRTRWQTWVFSRWLGGEANHPSEFFPMPFDTEIPDAGKPTEEQQQRLLQLLKEAREHNERVDKERGVT